jgi:N-acetylmuramoyl-L-alanine amidase
MIAATGDKDRGIKYRDDLYVLNGTKMPAVMVEVGFISNPAFEEKFKGNEYRDVLANAIVVGLIEGLSMPAPADRRVSKK